MNKFDMVAAAIEVQEGFHKKGSLPHRNNNPGNLKMGKLARKFGAISMDEQHHAIFPNAEKGRQALRYLLKTKFAGKTLREVGPVWAEDPDWAKKVAKISGVKIDEVLDA